MTRRGVTKQPIIYSWVSEPFAAGEPRDVKIRFACDPSLAPDRLAHDFTLVPTTTAPMLYALAGDDDECVWISCRSNARFTGDYHRDPFRSLVAAHERLTRGVR